MNIKRLTLIIIALVLTGCLDVTITQIQPTPNLVVGATPLFPTVTPTATTPPTVTPPPTEASPATAMPTPTPDLGPEGIGLVWRQAAVQNPVAVDGSIDRVAVLTANAEFVWLDGRTGDVRNRTVLWDAPAPFATTGSITVEGSLAIVTMVEQVRDEDTGRIDQRAQLLIVDGEGNTIWSLDTLTDGRRYHMVSTGTNILVGTAPRGFDDNQIAAYELFTGGRLWITDDTDLTFPGVTPTPRPSERPVSGYRQLAIEAGLGFALIDNGTGGGLMAFTVSNGDVLWVTDNRSDQTLRTLTVQGLQIVALSERTVLVVDGETGEILLRSAFRPDVSVGAAAFPAIITLAPAPTATLTRPGLVGMDRSGNVRWHSLIGLRAEDLAADGPIVWAILKDFDEGIVSLSGLNAEDGLEIVRVPVSEAVDPLHQIKLGNQRVYVLGDVISVYGY